jgi:hypothetical protein
MKERSLSLDNNEEFGDIEYYLNIMKGNSNKRYGIAINKSFI